MTRTEPRVLVLAATADDVPVFNDLLLRQYPGVRVCADPSDFTSTFERYQPDVLVLAMRTVAESERRYRDLFANDRSPIPPRYKTLLLCGKEDVQRAFELCRTDYFDDYILFWPMAHDAPRLSMSVHHALRFLAASRAAAVLPDLTLQARRIGALGEALQDERSVGSLHGQRARAAIEALGTSIRAALDAFGRRMVDTGLDDALLVRDIAGVMQALQEFDRDFIAPPVSAALEATTPVQQWIDLLPERLQTQQQAARVLELHASHARPLLLVVDDDEFMCKLLVRLLQTGGYDAEAVDSAAQAIAFLRGRQPNLILMDVRLPDMDGIALTRQLKATDAFASIPIIMLTGQGQRQVLVESRQAGAVDFVVKPFDRETLLKKVSLQLAMPS